MKLSLRAQLIVSFAVLCFIGFTLFFLTDEIKKIKSRRPLPVITELPEFSFQDQAGSPIGLKDLRGKVWLANFIFTRCAGPCPLMTGKFASLQHSLVDKSQIKLVSFSVDPEYDTRKVLQQYSEKFGAIEGVWFFLTGNKKDIYDLSVKGFKLAAAEEVAEGQHAILHSERFVLVDKWGRVRSYYNAFDAKINHLIIQDMNRLLAEATPAL